MSPDPHAHLCGLFRALVLGVHADLRIEVEVPTLFRGRPLTADPCVATGTTTAPAPGTGVWVMFEQGDPEHPVWLGVWKP